MKRIKVASLRAATVTILGFLIFDYNLASAQQRRKILVAYVAPGITQTIPWVTKEAGIFPKHGIDAEVILLTGSPRLIQTLLAGDVDYALGGVSSVFERGSMEQIRLFWRHQRTIRAKESCFVLSLPSNGCKT